MSVIVLGGLGFIGSHVVRALVKSNHTVRVFDRPGISHDLIADVEDQVGIIDGDAMNVAQVLEALDGIDTIIHLIHTTVPASSMRDPVFDINSNIAGTVGWLSELNKTSVKRIIYCSSGGTVYGVTQYNPIDEDHPTYPISSYGITKLAIEKYVSMYANLYDIDHIILRPSNVFGAGQKLHVSQGVIGVLIDRVLDGKPFEIWGDGLTIRDYLYVEDLASAIQSLLDYRGEQHIFNVGHGVGHSVLDIVNIMRDKIQIPFETVYKPAGGFAVPISVLECSRLNRETRWSAKVSLEDGISHTIEWIKKLKSE